MLRLPTTEHIDRPHLAFDKVAQVELRVHTAWQLSHQCLQLLTHFGVMIPRARNSISRGLGHFRIGLAIKSSKCRSINAMIGAREPRSPCI